MSYQEVYEGLVAALQETHYDQIALLQAAQRAYELLDASGHSLSEDEYLGLRMILSQAEREISFYFGN